MCFAIKQPFFNRYYYVNNVDKSYNIEAPDKEVAAHEIMVVHTSVAEKIWDESTGETHDGQDERTLDTDANAQTVECKNSAKISR